jgi:hypothetical protein
LLKIIGELAEPERLPAPQPATSAPLGIERNGHDTSGEPYVSIDCPKCLRTFQKTVSGFLSSIRDSPTSKRDKRPKNLIARQNLPVSPNCSTEKQGGGAPMPNISERNLHLRARVEVPAGLKSAR